MRRSPASPHSWGQGDRHIHQRQVDTELAGLTISIAAPTGQAAVALQSAGVQAARADLGEIPGWRRGLASRMAAPAGQAAVAFQSTGMVTACADLGECPLRRDGLAIIGKSSQIN